MSQRPEWGEAHADLHFGIGCLVIAVAVPTWVLLIMILTRLTLYP